MLNLFLMLLIGARDTLKQPGNEELNIAVVSIETTAHSNEPWYKFNSLDSC